MSIRDTSAQDRPVSAATAAGQHARKRRQQLLAAGIGVAVLLLAAWLVVGWAAGSRSFDGDRVRIAQVTRGDLVRDITADGRVIAANSPTLYAIAGGTVTLHVVAGDKVEKGQALAEIDSPELRSRLAQEEATLASVEAEATRAGLDIRNKKLLADRQRAVVGELQRQVDALTLRAPFDGQVGQVQVEQRANVAINAPVLGVVDLSRFEVEIKVPESFARDLAIGMPAQLTSVGKQFAGEVSAVSPEVVNGEVTARIRFKDKQPPGLRQNQRLSARILLDTRRNVLMVDRGPFLEQGGGASAYVMDGDSAVKRPIRTGTSSLGSVEILEGVEEGDRIVVSGSDLFGDAERVNIN